MGLVWTASRALILRKFKRSAKHNRPHPGMSGLPACTAACAACNLTDSWTTATSPTCANRVVADQRAAEPRPAPLHLPLHAELQGLVISSLCEAAGVASGHALLLVLRLNSELVIAQQTAAVISYNLHRAFFTCLSLIWLIKVHHAAWVCRTYGMSGCKVQSRSLIECFTCPGHPQDASQATPTGT
jgi:hypothetical protein